MEPTIEPHAVDNSKPDGRVVRSVLRSMLRFGDLTDVNLFPDDHHKSFADEYKLPGFIARSNLESLCKMSEEKLLKLACEIADSVRRVLEDKKDVLKFGEVEMKPSQIIERLYENLKLRVAVQRALYDAGASTSKGVSAVYSLVSKNPDCSVVGIGRDFPAWSWAEKEHDWNGRKDAALLFGIYIHGFGAWEDILNDDRLMMLQQRALKFERLRKRAENLLKRVPPPLSGPAGEPQLVQIASYMLNGNQVKGGRMQRAAERMAARRSDSGARDAVADDSIRKSNTQGTDPSRDRSRDRDHNRDRSRDRDSDCDQERSPDSKRDREQSRDRESAVRKHGHLRTALTVERLAFAAALGALVPSHLLLNTSDKALERLLPTACNHVLDIDLLLSADTIYPYLECMGSLGRTMYLEFYRFDLLFFPLIYSMSLFGVISRVWPTTRIFWAMPVLTAVADVLENAGMCVLLTQFPTRYTRLEIAVSIFTRTKGFFLVVSIVLMVIGLLVKAPPWKRTDPTGKQSKQD